MRQSKLRTFDISKSTAYRLLDRFEKDGGEVIRIGRLPRVSEDTITQYLRKINETHT